MLSIFKKETLTVTHSISNIKDLACEGHDYFSDELIILDEYLAGNLFCAEKVVIEQHGVLTGNITAKTCTVTGVVNGDILSLDLLDIRSNAVVRGNIQSATVNIEPGAVINGYITVGEDIEALTEQWNRTKFSTDDYLTTKLNKELTALNKASEANHIVVEQKIEPGLVTAVTKPEVKPEIVAGQPNPASVVADVELKPVVAPAPKVEKIIEEPPVTKPILAAAAPQKANEEPANNQRWW